MTSFHNKAKFENKTVVSRKMLKVVRSSINTKSDKRVPFLLWNYGQNQYTKLWIIDIHFSILPRINTTYAYGRNNNRFKCLMIYEYLPIHYCPTEYNITD